MSLESVFERFLMELKDLKGGNTAVEQRQKLREKWPGLKTGSYASEAYDRACKILKGIPEPDLIDRLIEDILPETAYNLDQLANVWETDIYCAEAYLYLCTISCALAPIGKDSYYLVESGEYQDPKTFGPPKADAEGNWAI